MKKILNYLHWRTLAAALWRSLVAIFDWRTHVRRLTIRPILDCAFITNMRDGTDRKRFLGKWRPACGHFNGPRYWINGVSGRTRALDVTQEDLNNPEGREKAKRFFISAVEWAGKRGAKVILLAAGTKRLFGEDAGELKALFPDIVFTIGDNGTVLLLQAEVLRALESSGLKPGFSRIGVLGPYGHLGGLITPLLIKKGYEVIGAGPNGKGLEKIKAEHGITTCENFSQMGKADAVVACTHSEKIRLDKSAIQSLARAGKKLLVLDVAEPSNLRYKVYRECQDSVVRQDGGNAHSPRLKYVLGAVSYKLFRLSQGVTFGCFAETLSLAYFMKREAWFKTVDWMTVSQANINLARLMFAATEFKMPSPRNFGKELKSFELNLDQEKKTAPKKMKLANSFANFL